jgi:RNA polymerase sigma-70 factor (ECF subfamily)
VSLNVIRNHLKKSKRKYYDFQYDKISSENFSTGSQAACFIEDKAREELLQSCLPELSPEIRELLVLRYYQNLSFESIAEITGLSLSAVKMRVYRGLEKLKKIMESM